MKSLLITVALGLAFAGTSPVAAQPATRTAAVSTAGLDLTTAKGQRTLELRLLHTASALCGTPSAADARGRMKYEECRAEARATAADQVRVLAERAGAVKVAVR
jgi:UrcA family protein